ncbi:MAG: hypothetical protein QXU32_11000 [Nitrososphaerales archaeon]
MRSKHRYLLAYSNDSGAMNIIRRKYKEKFGYGDLAKASIKLITYKDGFLVIRCNLSCYAHLREILSILDGILVPLNTSGTLKALGSRMDVIKKKLKGTDINVKGES